MGLRLTIIEERSGRSVIRLCRCMISWLVGWLGGVVTEHMVSRCEVGRLVKKHQQFIVGVQGGGGWVAGVAEGKHDEMMQGGHNTLQNLNSNACPYLNACSHVPLAHASVPRRCNQHQALARV